MNKLEVFKMASSALVGIGVMKTVFETTAPFVIKRNVVERLAVSSAQVVTGLLIADTASKFIDRKTDEIIAWLDQSAKKSAETE